ncbi:hypothetical protein DXG01_013003 [Tephrocybe rancida]|nr:hypothetical protein DXG01_013003 [Tephrocybe rancida]
MIRWLRLFLGPGFLDWRACVKVDPKFLNTERWELDPASLEDIVKAQIHDRVQEANSAEKIVLIFWSVIHGRTCAARDEDGALCSGTPMMRARKHDSALAKRKTHFITCSGWTKTWRDGHWTCNIPDNVDESLLSKLFLNKTINSLAVPESCSRLIPANIGSKAGFCPHVSKITHTIAAESQPQQNGIPVLLTVPYIFL